MQLVTLFLILLFGLSHGTKQLPEGVYYISLDSSANMSMYWSLDYDQKYVRFEIHLPLRKWDWFAIGFSDYGEFYPADFCILWSDRKWRTEFQVSFYFLKFFVFFFLMNINLIPKYDRFLRVKILRF